MLKTSNYNLNKPEPNDPLRLEDFNENADLIDAALNGLNTAVGAAGNCKIVMGSYVGAGAYGASKPCTLDFKTTLGTAPKLVCIADPGGDYKLLLIHGVRSQFSNTASYASSYLSFITWTETGVSWYSEAGANYQLNNGAKTYYYVAFA